MYFMHFLIHFPYHLEWWDEMRCEWTSVNSLLIQLRFLIVLNISLTLQWNSSPFPPLLPPSITIIIISPTLTHTHSTQRLSSFLISFIHSHFNFQPSFLIHLSSFRALKMHYLNILSVPTLFMFLDKEIIMIKSTATLWNINLILFIFSSFHLGILQM